MSLTRRSLLALTGAGAVGGLLAGCAGNLPKINTSAASFGRNGSGQVEVWCRAATQTGIQVIVDNFHRSQDRIRVRVTAVPDAQFVTKLATAIRGGRVPDLVDFDDINSMPFIYRGAFANLTDPISKLPNSQDLSPGHLNLATVKGRTYAMPFLADNSVLFCNTELFEKAGLDVDESTKSLETLLEAARKISKLGNGIYGWSYPGNSEGALGFTVQPHIWAANTDLIKGDLGAQSGNVAGNGAVRATLEFVHSLWAEKLVPPLSYADDASHWGSDYLAGKIGIFPASYGAVVPAASKDMIAKTTIRLIPGPTGAGASSTAVTTSACSTAPRMPVQLGNSWPSASRRVSSSTCRRAATRPSGPTPRRPRSASSSRSRCRHWTTSNSATHPRRWPTT
ncbi:hypothetical protein GCM10027613_29240 [Microlunatus endophyticus]